MGSSNKSRTPAEQLEEQPEDTQKRARKYTPGGLQLQKDKARSQERSKKIKQTKELNKKLEKISSSKKKSSTRVAPDDDNEDGEHDENRAAHKSKKRKHKKSSGSSSKSKSSKAAKKTSKRAPLGNGSRHVNDVSESSSDSSGTSESESSASESDEESEEEEEQPRKRLCKAQSPEYIEQQDNHGDDEPDELDGLAGLNHDESDHRDAEDGFLGQGAEDEQPRFPSEGRNVDDDMGAGLDGLDHASGLGLGDEDASDSDSMHGGLGLGDGDVPFPQTSSRASSIPPSVSNHTSRASSVRPSVGNRRGGSVSQSSTRATVTASHQNNVQGVELNTGGRTTDAGKERGRSRVKDFARKERSSLRVGTSVFKGRLCSHKPFGSATDEYLIADESYDFAAALVNHDGTVTAEKRETILHGSSNVKGAVKDKVFPYVPEAFGFVAATPGDTLKVEQNKLQHDWLVSNRNFMYAKSSYKTKERSHPLQHAFVGRIIQEQFFNNAQSAGIIDEKTFNPITLELICFLYSIALFYIREWKNGYREKGKFSSAVAAKDYEGILVDAQLLENSAGTKELIATLRQRLYDNARSRCGITAQATVSAVASLTEADIARMAQDGLLED